MLEGKKNNQKMKMLIENMTLKMRAIALTDSSLVFFHNVQNDSEMDRESRIETTKNRNRE